MREPFWRSLLREAPLAIIGTLLLVIAFMVGRRIGDAEGAGRPRERAPAGRVRSDPQALDRIEGACQRIGPACHLESMRRGYDEATHYDCKCEAP